MNLLGFIGHGEMRKSYLVLLLLLLCSFPLYGKQSKITGLRIWSAPDHVRLVFDADSQIGHKIFTLTGPDRLDGEIK
jgi:N-acetylmuramoyl-L-alanine amidase